MVGAARDGRLAVVNQADDSRPVGGQRADASPGPRTVAVEIPLSPWMRASLEQFSSTEHRSLDELVEDAVIRFLRPF